MLKHIDRSQRLNKLIQKLSEGTAKQRGLPVVIGIILIVISMALQSIDVFTDSNIIELLGVLAHHLGVLIALVGLTIAVPLGK